MDPKTNHQFRRMPKGERRVRFADSMGMDLVSIFLFDFINNYYFASIHSQILLKNPQRQIEHDQKPPHPLLKQPQKQQQQYQQLEQQQQPQPLHQKPILNQCHQNHYNQYQKQQLPSYGHQFEQQQQQQQYQQQQYIQHHHYHNQQQQQQQQHQNQQQRQNQIQTLSSQPVAPIQQHNYVCEFTQPISLISFKERVRLNKVHLETCSVNSRAGNISISCTIRVLNQSYDKSVIVRYTTDEWHTFTDCLASYKPGSNDGWSDKFTSTFSVSNQLRELQAKNNNHRIVFAIKYTFDGDKVSWDNNGGLNYVVKKF